MLGFVSGWRLMAWRSVRHAWGLAPEGDAWTLVGLARHSPDLVRLDSAQSLQAPGAWALAELGWLSEQLRQHSRPHSRSNSRPHSLPLWRALASARQRLNLALSASQVQEGSLELPSHVAPEQWLYEVQLDVSQALQLPPEEVNFDFVQAPTNDDRVQRVHWMGCARAPIDDLKACVRAAGWRLAAVESPAQAAWRGLLALQGGSASLLTQAPQDWQFKVSPHSPMTAPNSPPASPEERAQTLGPILQTTAGPPLVAAGLALRAWQ